MKQTLKRIGATVLTVGPGIFCIGYTIGTGSVTSMAKAGSQYGMQLLWVLALSCLFSWVLLEAYGRFAVVTGDTAIHGFRRKLPMGNAWALVTTGGVIIGQWCCLSGLVGLSAGALYECAALFIPGLTRESYAAVLAIAVVIMAAMYAMLWVGKYSFFEKVLVFFVTIMGVAFLLSMFIVMPSPGEIARGLLPSVPQAPGARIMIAAFVGTTMAAPTFVVRPLLLRAKGWTREHRALQRRDSVVSATMMFVISGSIMACATGALFHQGKTIDRVLDMVTTLEPVAGRFAVAIFLVGTLSAGLSSIFPIAMVAPLLIADYRAGTFDTRTKLFRILTAVACCIGLTVPILGANPIAAQILTQTSQVFVLPLVIAGVAVLVNRRSAMGDDRAGPLLNIGLAAAFLFSCAISYTAALALADMLRGAL